MMKSQTSKWKFAQFLEARHSLIVCCSIRLEKKDHPAFNAKVDLVKLLYSYTYPG